MLRRSVTLSARVGSMAETLKPTPGMSQGTLSKRTQVSQIPQDKENEAKWPIFRREVAPRAGAKSTEHSKLSTYYKWGFKSLTLFHQVGEQPGPWSTANDTAVTTDYAQAGDFAAAGLHSGIWPHAKGLGQYNTKPTRLRGWAYGRKADAKSGAVAADWGSTLDAAKATKLVFPHTKEHDKHKRVKNPALAGFGELKEAAHGKRILRECQYHLGQGMRFYMLDSYFGSHPGTATSIRVFTDNPDHAYIASMNGVRNKNIMFLDGEHMLNTVSETSPLEEFCWRRPSVLVYHCPSFDFELPRIVEEFGGPRPQDMSLVPGNPQFQVLEPYSIPMKAMVGALPNPNTLFDTVGFLASRWGFYADDRRLLTFPNAEAAVSAGNDGLTVVVNTSGLDTAALRQSPFLYCSRHVRLGNGVVSRCWDGTDVPASGSKPHRLDLVDEELKTVHRPLSTRVCAKQPEDAFSHRFTKARNCGALGYKMPHQYTADGAAQAASAGMLFGNKTSSAPRGRPAAFNVGSVKFVVVGDKKGSGAEAAAKAIVEGIAKNSLGLYADEEALANEIKSTLANAASVEVVSKSEAQSVLDKLAKSGSA